MLQPEFNSSARPKSPVTIEITGDFGYIRKNKIIVI